MDVKVILLNAAAISSPQALEDALVQAIPEKGALIRARGRFARAYCERVGWDFENLSMLQIQEIRLQPGWPREEEADG